LLTSIGTIFGISGALLIALNIDMMLLAYSLFLLSVIIWGHFAISTNNQQLLIMNAVYGIINLIGIYNFL
jgi:hypothetical protein